MEKSRKRQAESNDDEPSTKHPRGRLKKVINLSRYPAIRKDADSDDSSQQYDAIAKELEKPNPRKEILLPLMKATFYSRRKYVLESNDSVFNKLSKFPGLKLPSLVCM